MFDFLPSAEPDESDPIADEPTVEPIEASASTIPAAEPTAVISDVTEGTQTETESPDDFASEESEASTDTVEADRPNATPEEEKPVAASKAATGEESLVDLPDFSHEPTEPGQYTLRIVFTFRPGDQSVLLSTQSHDVLAIVGELDPEGARALLAPFIAAHDARLSEIKQALTKSPAKAPVRSNAAKKTPPASSTSSTSTKTPAAKKDKPTKVVKPTSPAALPQTNLFND
ncbi:MAG: hypothetical protein JNL73_22190 [Anaerolineales bacterium]|nr:hypothetical protein [Anaerolineales bacterium]